MDVDRDVLSAHPRELDRGTHEVLLLVLADVHSEILGEHGECENAEVRTEGLTLGCERAAGRRAAEHAMSLATFREQERCREGGQSRRRVSRW